MKFMLRNAYKIGRVGAQHYTTAYACGTKRAIKRGISCGRLGGRSRGATTGNGLGRVIGEPGGSSVRSREYLDQESH